MTTHCGKCGAEVEAGWTVCRKCFEPVKRPGLLTRLRRFFSGLSVSVVKPSGSTGGTRVSLNVSEPIKVRNAETGEVREYGSLEEVPPELRESVRLAREAAAGGRSASVFQVQDASGSVRTYNSPDELPPELRAIYEKMRRPES